MRKRKAVKKIYCFFFCLIFMFLLLFLPMKETLVFQYQNSGKVLAYIPVTEGDIFKIKYTHSIHLSPVVECFKITIDREIMLYELQYEEFAVGMPENASNGEIFEHKNGKYYLQNMNNRFPSIDLRIGKVRANHTLICNEQEYPLSRFIEPGTWVRIKIEKLNLWQLWKGVNILEQ